MSSALCMSLTKAGLPKTEQYPCHSSQSWLWQLFPSLIMVNDGWANQRKRITGSQQEKIDLVWKGNSKTGGHRKRHPKNTVPPLARQILCTGRGPSKGKWHILVSSLPPRHHQPELSISFFYLRTNMHAPAFVPNFLWVAEKILQTFTFLEPVRRWTDS